jgi:hypothetical protein
MSEKMSVKTVLIMLFVIALSSPHPSYAEKEKKPPVTTYWMSVATQNMIIPGMSSEEMSGMGGFTGKMMGGPAFGPARTLLLQLNSPKELPPDPQATHDIPPGQKMGETLPLMIPEHEKARPERYDEKETAEKKIEKPKMRMLIYWGCSEEIRKGQPLVVDTEKMNPMDFGKAFAGRTPAQQYPPSERKGWIYAEWPNRKNSKEVAKDSSLQGGHFVHGNYNPDIKFTIDRMHDFMAPVEFTSMKGSLAESIGFEWKSMPTAIGYLATAMAHNEGSGETIFWSSSEVKETGFGLMDYLTPADVQRFIKEKVVMEQKVTTCNIPKGIFKDTGGGMLQFIAYGDEMNVVYPPKPRDRKEPWNPIWTVKVRLKSTGMSQLGGAEDGAMRKPNKRRIEKYEEEPAEQPQEPEKKPEESPIKKLRKGIFGF